MFVGFTNGHDGQEEHIEIIGQARHNFTHHALTENRVGGDRQMRTMLLMGRDGRDRNGAIRVEGFKVLGGQVAPITPAHVHVL